MCAHPGGNQSWSHAGEDRIVIADRPSVREYAMLEELGFVRREAQADAEIAYADWQLEPCRARYAVYLAAQDRADAAQDQLASWSRRLILSIAAA